MKQWAEKRDQLSNGTTSHSSVVKGASLSESSNSESKQARAWSRWRKETAAESKNSSGGKVESQRKANGSEAAPLPEGNRGKKSLSLKLQA